MLVEYTVRVSCEEVVVMVRVELLLADKVWWTVVVAPELRVEVTVAVERPEEVTVRVL